MVKSGVAEVEDRLRYILSLVNEWLKFAEAKNGALLAVDSAMIFGVFKLSESGWPHVGLFYLTISVLIASAVSCLISFIPKLKMPTFTMKREPDSGDSLIYYGHIAKYNPENYLKALYGQADTGSVSPSSLEVDYAKQIVTNSRIALRKYFCFTVALWFAVGALTLLLIASLCLATSAS